MTVSPLRRVGALSVLLGVGCLPTTGGPTGSETVNYTSSSSSGGSTAGSSSSSSSSAASSSSSSSSASSSSGSSGSSSGSVSTVSSSSGSSSGSSGAWVIGPHQPFPQVPNNDPTDASGVLSHVNVVAITYNGDPQQTQIEGFLQWIVGSTWLDTVGSDYGVANGALAGTYRLAGPAPFEITDGEIQTQIIELIQQGHVPAPPPTGSLQQSLYAIFFPESTRISGSDGVSCQDYGGYHGEIDFNGARFAYAVLPTCNSQTTENTLDYTEIAMSHELIEAATDPYPNSGPTYAIDDPGNPWSFVPGEIGDLCVGNNTIFDGNAVQRIWSNSAAADGGDPCVPVPPHEVYFNVSLTPTSTTLASAGTTVTFQLQAWSTGPVPTADGTWNLYAQASYSSFNANPVLSTNTVKNGDTATLTLTIPANAIPNQDYASVIVESYTSTASGGQWPVAVFVQ